MWSNKYIGIPYVDKGRDTAGSDCWGLVRLVYKEELNIELPSFFSDYTVSDTDRIYELMSQYKEGWEQLSLPSDKSVVLFKILGKVSHIGVMINEHQFLHTKRNQDSSIESINNPKWANRVAGFFKYTEKAFDSLPEALKTTELKVEVTEGFTIGNAYDAIYLNENFPEDLKDNVILFVDGIEVNKEADWDTLVLDGQKLEYRLVANDSKTLRSVLTVIVVIAAIKLAPILVANLTGASAASAGAAAIVYPGATMLAQSGIMMIGMALVNAIAPIRPPDASIASGGMDSSNPQLLLNSARNEARQYEAIPVVLGKYRLVAPVAAVNYMTVDTDISYLRMLLCWGYGPVELTDMRVGPTAISDYLDSVEQSHVYGYTADDLSTIYKIYGTDTFQLLPNLELPYTEPGVPGATYIPGGGAVSDWTTRVISTPVNSISISLHFPQGLRGVYRAGESAGVYYPVPFSCDVEVAELDPITLEPPGGVGTEVWISPCAAFSSKKLNLVANPVKISMSSDEFGNSWQYGAGYTNNIIYISESGELGVVAGVGYNTLGSTTAISTGQYSGAYTYISTTPKIPTNAHALYTIIVYGSIDNLWAGNIVSKSVHSTVDTRAANGIVTSGGSGALTISGTVATVAAGTTTLAMNKIFYGLSDQPFYLRKDAFTGTINFDLNDVPTPYKVRVRRTSSALFDFEATDTTNKPYYYNKAYLYMITGVNSDVNAVKPIKNCNLALSAFKIRATDQLNGSIEGINAVVHSVCLDYELSTHIGVSTATLISNTGYSHLNVVNMTAWNTIQNKVFVGSIISNHAGFAAPVTVQSIVNSGSTVYLVVSANADTSSSDSSYDISNNLWVSRATSNPASLFRYVLQHPANMQAISTAEASSKLDITALQEWHTFCNTNGFTYNAAISQHKSLLEVLRDICAAGRASPMLANGKWGVVIDKPRTTLVQHFTPHNSWGFESTRVLSTAPHALRVNYINANDEYQSNEVTVYSFDSKRVNITSTAGSITATCNIVLAPTIGSPTINTLEVVIVNSTTIPAGTKATVAPGSTTLTLASSAGVTTGTSTCNVNVPYDSSTATIFETIQLPGTTNTELAIKHTKFHIAQAMLRPEIYSINTDMEHLVCNRGDLVRVTHDVPMWGMATGRIKNLTTPTQVELSESVLLEAGIIYSIRIRDKSGNSITRTVLPVVSTDYYNTVTIDTALNTIEGAANNLFMLGKLNSESAEMIVVGIEPSNNLTAKVTLTDYSPDVYNSTTKFTSLPLFGTQITPPIAYSRNYIVSVPTVVSDQIRSDESVMALSGSSYVYKISIPYTNRPNLEKNITHVEYRMCLTSDTSKSWRMQGNVPIGSGAVVLSDVIEGLSYTLQLRYVSASGFVGPWTTEITHTIVGKSTVPSAPTGLTLTVEAGFARLKWNKNPEIDVIGYEVGTNPLGWLSVDALFSGDATSCLIDPTVNTSQTWYVKAIDAAKLSSPLASITRTFTSRSAPVLTTPYFTGNTVLISWTAPLTGDFAVDRYIVQLTASGMTTKTATLYSTEWKVPVEWTGTATFSVYAIDASENVGATATLPIIKNAPNQVTNVQYTFSNTGTGQFTNIKWDAATVDATRLTVKQYNLSITKPGIGTENKIIYGTTYTTDANWEGSATFAITTVDVADAAGTALNVPLVKVAPAAPTVPVVTPKGSGVVISFTAAAAGSLPIAGYQLSTSSASPNTNPYIYKGSSSTIDVTSVSASNTWYLFSYDTAGKYCTTPLTVPKIFSGPSTPLNIQASFTRNTALFRWTPPATSEFAIDRYDITLTAAGMDTVTAKLYTTDWEVPVGWSNTTATITITPVDIAGFSYSGPVNTTTNQKTLQKDKPTIPAQPTLTPIGTNLDIDWADNLQTATQLGILSYEIKTSTGTSVWRGSGSKAQISLIGKPKSVQLDYNLYAYDYNNIQSDPKAFWYTPTAPTEVSIPSITYSFGNSLTDASLTLNWGTVTTEYGLACYEVSYDTTTIRVNSNTLTITPLPTGWVAAEKVFTIKTVDLLTNKSTGSPISVYKDRPATVSTYSAQVIDNNVMLYWSYPTRTSLPIVNMRVKKSLASDVAATWNTAESIGDKNGTFTTIFERTGGKYKYWMAAVDTDQQEGTPISFPVTVSQPPDFIFNGELVSTLNGTLSKAIIDTGRVVMPVDKDITYAQHFTHTRVLTMTVAAGGTGYAVNDTFRLNSGTVNATDYATGIVTTVSGGVVTGIAITGRGTYSVAPITTAGATTVTSGTGTGLTVSITTSTWTTPSAQVSANYPVYIQPTLATGYYEEVFDFGTTLGSSQITLTKQDTIIDGAPTIVTAISYSNNNVDYSNTDSASSIFATNFRYVKIRVTATQNDNGKGLYSLSNLSVRLDSKIINGSGITNCVSSHADGTVANFDKEYVDISAISVTPSGSTAMYPVYDFKDRVIPASYSVVSNVCSVNTAFAANWTRLTTTATITLANHGYIVGDVLNVTVSSDVTAIPLGNYTVVSIGAGTFTITVPNAGGASGTLTLGIAHGFSANALGQNVRLSFNSGTATNTIAAVTSVSNSMQFTTALVTANTSGTLTIYSQGMRIYLYNGSGVRTTGTVSWSIRGN